MLRREAIKNPFLLLIWLNAMDVVFAFFVKHEQVPALCSHVDGLASRLQICCLYASFWRSLPFHGDSGSSPFCFLSIRIPRPAHWKAT